MTLIFGEWAERFYDAGYAPVPLGHPQGPEKAAKAAFQANWQKFSRERWTRQELHEHIAKFGDRNIGLVCGGIMRDGLQLIGLDIDRPQLEDELKRAMPGLIVGKKGNKGSTWFALAPADMETKRISDSAGIAVEFLAIKSQTVIPPSVHPISKQPYYWIDGVSLLDIRIEDLPTVTNSLIIECEEIVGGRGQHFVGGQLAKGQQISGLNHMSWVGVGKGGDTHDTRLAAIGHMVATGWTDDEILVRVERAQREAVERAGEVFNWPGANQQHREMIESARKKGFGDRPASAGKKGKVPQERQWANWLESEIEHAAFYGGQIFTYEDGWYKAASNAKISQMVVRQFHDANSSKAEAAFKTFCLMKYVEQFGPEKGDRVCLLNGTLDTSTMELKPWSPEDQLIHQLSLNWDQDAKCPMYDEFVKWVFGDDQSAVDCWDEFCGLTLIDDMSYHKMLFLLGASGGNGKSTLANVLSAIHSRESVATVPITSLNDERMMTSLVGKMLNVSSEQSRINLIADDVLKKITGGDAVAVRRLFQEVDNNVHMKVRFLCLANEMPSTSDTSDAMRRRLMILRCDNVKPEGERDPLLKDKLLQEKEGILARWVIAANRLRARGHFVEPESSKKVVQEFMVMNDALKAWIRMRVDPVSEEWMEITTVYTDFAEWAKLAGYKYPIRLPEFGPRLRQAGFQVEERRLPGNNLALAVKLKYKSSVTRNIAI